MMNFSPQEVFSEPCDPGETKRKLENEFTLAQQEKMDVYLRIRPILPSEILVDHKPCVSVDGDNSVHVKAPIVSGKQKGSHDSSSPEQKFVFTQAFCPDTDQIQFFETTMKSTIENFILGQNGLVFAYGSSGSGKTYTMQGTHAKPGVIPLTVQLLFSSIKGKQVQKPFFKPHKYCDVERLTDERQNLEESFREKFLGSIELEDLDSTKCISGKLSSVSLSTIFSDDSSWDNSCHSDLSEKEMLMLQSSVRMKDIGRTSVCVQGEVLFSVWISFMEIYNENIYDLLEPISSNKRSRLSVKEDDHKNLFVKGLKEIRVCSSEEALKLLHFGKKNLRIASTKLNYQSSRSHCIFNIKIVRVLDANNPVSARVNKLSFCDLAGSERTAKTQNTGLRLKEASNINNSLLVLGRCLEGLRQGNREKKVVPFRDSKLTRLFSGFFTGKGKASMIVNVSPSSSMYNETLTVLKFSSLAKQVISNEISSKPSLSISCNLPERLTEAWGISNARWSSFIKANTQLKESFTTVCETSMDEEEEEKNDEVLVSEIISEKDKIIQELLVCIKTYQENLEAVILEKDALDSKIRAKVCREFAEHFVQIDDCYRDQLNGTEEINDIVLRRRSKIKKKESNTSDEIEEGEIDENCNEGESNYTTVSGGVSYIISEKSLTRAEESTLENSTLESIIKELKDEVCSKNHKIQELSKKIDQLNEMNLLKHLQDSCAINFEHTTNPKDADDDPEKAVVMEDNINKSLDGTTNSKDKEILVLKEKIEEIIQAASTKDSKLNEFQENLNFKDKQIKELEESVEQGSQAVALGKSCSMCSEHATNPKDAADDLAKTVALEEKLKKHEEALESKNAEICVLQKKLNELDDALKSKGKEIIEFETAICSKETEINTLKTKLEQQKEEMDIALKNSQSELDIKDLHILEMQKEIDTLKNDVKSKEKEVEEFANVIFSKDSEITNLTFKLDEKNKVAVPNENDLKDYEALLREKDKEIMALKNETELKKSQLDDDHIRYTKDAEITALKDIIDAHLKSLRSKEEKMQEYKDIIALKENEISALKVAIKDQNETISSEETMENAEAWISNSKDGNLEALMKKLKEQMEFFKPMNCSRPGKEMVIASFDILNIQTAKIDELTKECEGLKKKFASDNKLIVEKDEMLEKARKMLEDARKITKDEEIERLGKSIALLESRIETENKNNKEKEDILSKHLEFLRILQNLINVMEKKLEKKEENLLKQSNSVVEKEELIKELQETNDQILCELGKVQNSLSKLTNIAVEKDKVIEELQESKNKVLCELKMIKQNVSKKNDENLALNAVSFLQNMEYISAENSVNLQRGNRKLSERIEELKLSVIELENRIEVKECECISQRREIEALKKVVPKRKSAVTDLEERGYNKHENVSYVMNVLQQIECTSTENLKRLLSDNVKATEENDSLREELKAAKIELDMANKEIDSRETEHIRIADSLRKNYAQIEVLEKNLKEVAEKSKTLEMKHSAQIYEEREQHCVEIESAMSLKRQIEAEWRRCDGNDDFEISDQQKKSKGPKREKRGRPRKQLSIEQQDDFEPPPKRKAGQNKKYNEDEENTSPSSVAMITLDNERLLPATSAQNTSIQRLAEYVAEKSPAFKSVARRLAIAFSPKSGTNEDSNSSVLNRRKKRLFNNTCAPQLVTSPVREIVTTISPKKIVAMKLRRKKTAK